jgi:hypothetical protein
MFPHPIALPVFLRIDCLLFDVNFAHGAPFSVTSAAWKWVLPNAEKVGMSLPRFGGRKADALLGEQEGQSMPRGRGRVRMDVLGYGAGAGSLGVVEQASDSDRHSGVRAATGFGA